MSDAELIVAEHLEEAFGEEVRENRYWRSEARAILTALADSTPAMIEPLARALWLERFHDMRGYPDSKRTGLPLDSWAHRMARRLVGEMLRAETREERPTSDREKFGGYPGTPKHAEAREESYNPEIDGCNLARDPGGPAHAICTHPMGHAGSHSWAETREEQGYRICRDCRGTACDEYRMTCTTCRGAGLVPNTAAGSSSGTREEQP